MLYYDENDSRMWGLQYDVFYTNTEEFKVPYGEESSDIYFCGWAKNRYEEVIVAYEKLTEQGFLYDFHIMGVPKEQRLYENQINYEIPLSYRENLIRAGKSRCILEIIQYDSVGNTLRVYEAIILDKLLLTNNPALGKAVCTMRDGCGL